MKRRTWLISALGAAGALVVGWGVLPARSRLGSPDSMLPTEGDVALNGWIKITRQGDVVLAMPRSEMGQGVHTALAMLVAEELDMPLQRVRLEQAGSSSIYGNVAMLVGSLPFHPLDTESESPPVMVQSAQWMVGKLARELGIVVTGGSSSVADAWLPLREAAATARASLVQAAARQWGVPASEIEVRAGVLRHATGKTAQRTSQKASHYGEWASLAAGTPLTEPIVLKDRKNWTLLGQAIARPDIPSKTNGSAQFGIDVRLPGMLFARVRMAPMLGGTVQTMDTQAAMAISGVQRVVRLSAQAGSTAGFAVIARTNWHAQQGVQAVQVQWAPGAASTLHSARIDAELEALTQSEQGTVFYSKGDTPRAEASAKNLLTAVYRAPYLAHATLEPMNCTARVKDGKVEVWAPTQVPGMAVDIAARVADVDASQVTLHVTLLGGGFGRRLEVDTVAQAVYLALHTDGQAVQLVWSREEDMTHDFYRPMQVARLHATLDEQGAVQSLRVQSAGDAITPRWLERGLPHLSGPMDTPDKTTAEGLFDLPYGIAHQRMSHWATHMRVPVGFWRSVGHSHNAFFSESFVDELAHAAGQDPVAYRRSLLAHAPRHLAVLQLAADKAAWGKKLPPGHAYGVALHESFGSIVAQVAQVSIEASQPRVHTVVCAIDCGTVINPNTVAQQMESAVIFGLSAALFGKIDIHEGVVQQNNFHNYPVVQLAQAPVVHTFIVPSQRAPSGVGEPGLPPIAPAVGNALFKLTAKRLRSLPLIV
jgi:isoquinoline 1-oxidoreductase subunit beta